MSDSKYGFKCRFSWRQFSEMPIISIFLYFSIFFLSHSSSFSSTLCRPFSLCITPFTLLLIIYSKFILTCSIISYRRFDKLVSVEFLTHHLLTTVNYHLSKLLRNDLSTLSSKLNLYEKRKKIHKITLNK